MNDIVDIYQFTVAVDGSLVILDIDNGFGEFVPEAGDLPPNFPLFNPRNDVDLKLELFDATFAQVAGGSNSSSFVTNGALGSVPIFTFSTTTADPFLQLNLLAGTYYVAVSPEATEFDAGNLSFTLPPAERPRTGTYDLHISVDQHATDGGDAGNASYRFDRSTPVGTLSSRAFDLTGYGPTDLPRFYFNYFYDPDLGDSVTIRATSNENAAGAILSDVTLQPNIAGNLTGDSWRQGVASLAGFAGHTNIQIEFIYNTVGTSITAEGLYLDDFIIGFAERGELITNADPGVTGVSGTSFTQAGEYQLEVRPGTEYATPSFFGLQLDKTFDTNSRQGQFATILRRMQPRLPMEISLR